MDTGHFILVLLLIGVWGLIRKRNLIKKVIALNVVNSAIVMLFLYGGASGDNAPILVGGITDIVDPVPQALMLTAIVVGICLTALALALAYQMYLKYQTLDIIRIEALVDQEEHG